MSGRFVFGDPLPGQFEQWVKECFQDIEQADAENIEAIVGEFSVTGAFTETRTFDASSATLADLRNFLATLVTDIKKGGQKRSYGS